MEKEELANELMKMFISLKKAKFLNISECSELTHNEKLVLFLVNELSLKGQIQLSDLREKIELAPSTITPIISSLEEKGLLERNIDKADRRNIFLKLSKEGKLYTKKVHEIAFKNTTKYIDYMGKEDSIELIRLISKTTKFFKERENK
jgi:DNA-binding MarR family transcriptional regulator